VARTRRAAITIDHLLRMSSGLRFDEGMSSPRSDVMRMLFTTADAGRFAVDRPLEAAPGSRWQYSSATTNILSRIIRNVVADDEAYLTFPRRALFEPLGMSTAVMETDAAGTFVASSYLHASARDWARFGSLYLEDGVADGGRLLPEGWVQYSIVPAPADPSSRYGAHFWVQVPEEYAGKDPHLPVPAFHAAGHEGQFVTIVPSYDAVIVRLGRTRYPGVWDHAAFIRDVLAGLAAPPPRQ
jgi:CubicO group peptidase (beta-lactamase class C family)